MAANFNQHLSLPLCVCPLRRRKIKFSGGLEEQVKDFTNQHIFLQIGMSSSWKELHWRRGGPFGWRKTPPPLFNFLISVTLWLIICQNWAPKILINCSTEVPNSVASQKSSDATLDKLSNCINIACLGVKCHTGFSSSGLGSESDGIMQGQVHSWSLGDTTTQIWILGANLSSCNSLRVN